MKSSEDNPAKEADPMKTTTDRRTTDPDTLFITDNGSILCGEHLGASARFTGRDISGQAIEEITAASLAEFRSIDMEPSCESCGKGSPEPCTMTDCSGIATPTTHHGRPDWTCSVCG